MYFYHNYAIIDGVNTLETNMAYGVVDTIMEENEAYGDGRGIGTMERNIAYSAVIMTHDNLAGEAVVDGGINRVCNREDKLN